jgi:hypothetical protein
MERLKTWPSVRDAADAGAKIHHRDMERRFAALGQAYYGPRGELAAARYRGVRQAMDVVRGRSRGT